MSQNSKIVMEGLTFDDVLLVPQASSILPHEVSLKTKTTKNLELNVPILSAAMDTVTEAELAIAIAREGGIGFIHKNMTIERQAEEVERVKRYESGMITNPVTLSRTKTLKEADEVYIPSRLQLGENPYIHVTGKVVDKEGRHQYFEKMTLLSLFKNIKLYKINSKGS